MTQPGREVIAALATGPGRTAVAVLRISGSGAGDLLVRLAGPLPRPRRATLRTLRHPATGEALDRALVVWFPAPGSYTGEDAAELHLHGGPAVKTAVLRAVLEGGARLAEPGEFTRRAFLNGKLDLTAAEGVADLIEAETDGQRRQALRQTEGRLASALAGWRERLLGALARCEAGLDFTDEADVPDDVAAGVEADLADIAAEIADALASAERGERVREGFTVVIAGPPNAGKSTLLNAIARREVAIVSPIPGTTRDAIELRCDLGGWPVLLVDTAGLRDSPDPVEQEGVRRARARAASADLVLWLRAPDGDEALPTALPSSGAATLTVWTKSDLAVGTEPRSAGPDELAVSARTGAGMAELLDRLTAWAPAALEGGAGGDAVLTRERHRVVIREVAAALERARAVANAGAPELVAEELRLALRALGRMTGAVDNEEVLDRIFSSFCIGK